MAVPEPGVSPSTASTLVNVVLTDANGRFRLKNVPPGRYYILAGLVDQPTYYPGVSALSGATAVSVPGSDSLCDGFPNGRAGRSRVRGHVTRPANLATANNLVALIGAPNPAQQTTVAADGSFEFLKVRPGTYSITASPALAQPISLVVTDKDITDLELRCFTTKILRALRTVETVPITASGCRSDVYARSRELIAHSHNFK